MRNLNLVTLCVKSRVSSPLSAVKSIPTIGFDGLTLSMGCSMGSDNWLVYARPPVDFLATHLLSILRSGTRVLTDRRWMTGGKGPFSVKLVLAVLPSPNADLKKKVEHVDKQKLRFLLVTCWYNPASNDLLMEIIDPPVRRFFNSTFKFWLLHGDANFAL